MSTKVILKDKDGNNLVIGQDQIEGLEEALENAGGSAGGSTIPDDRIYLDLSTEITKDNTMQELFDNLTEKGYIQSFKSSPVFCLKIGGGKTTNSDTYEYFSVSYYGSYAVVIYDPKTFRYFNRVVEDTSITISAFGDMIQKCIFTNEFNELVERVEASGGVNVTSKITINLTDITSTTMADLFTMIADYDFNSYTFSFVFEQYKMEGNLTYMIDSFSYSVSGPPNMRFYNVKASRNGGTYIFNGQVDTSMTIYDFIFTAMTPAINETQYNELLARIEALENK